MGRPTRIASTALAVLVAAALGGCGPAPNRVGSPGGVPVTPPPPTRATRATPSASEAPGAAVFLVPMTRLDQRAVRPRDAALFKDLDLRAMTWTSWTATEATGTGTVSINPCTPSCADANYVTGPARIVLAAPASGCGITFFTRLSIAWTASPPEGHPPASTLALPDPVC